MQNCFDKFYFSFILLKNIGGFLHMDKILQSLTRFNFIMGTLHFVQGVMMLVLSLTWSKIIEFTPTIYTNFLTFNTATQSLETNNQAWFQLPFGILVACFLFLSAAAHFLISVPKKTNNIYKQDLQKNINQFRWYEYALSSSLMIVLIAVLFGVYDFTTLLAIVGLNVSMNLFGLLMEKNNQAREKTDWTPFVFGSLAGIIPWVIIIMNGFGNSNPDLVPWFAYAIAGTYFVFFNCFPINMILQYKRVGKWRDYLYGERAYIILSLVAKTTLAWLVLFGVMQPN